MEGQILKAVCYVNVPGQNMCQSKHSHILYERYEEKKLHKQFERGKIEAGMFPYLDYDIRKTILWHHHQDGLKNANEKHNFTSSLAAHAFQQIKSCFIGGEAKTMTQSERETRLMHIVFPYIHYKEMRRNYLRKIEDERKKGKLEDIPGDSIWFNVPLTFQKNLDEWRHIVDNDETYGNRTRWIAFLDQTETPNKKKWVRPLVNPDVSEEWVPERMHYAACLDDEDSSSSSSDNNQDEESEESNDSEE